MAGSVSSAGVESDRMAQILERVRADGTLAKGARQRALLERVGVPFRGEQVDMRVARLPDC